VIVARVVLKQRAKLESTAFGHGSLWLAFGGGSSNYPPGRPLPGRLLRMSAATLRVTASWPIVGSPIGLTITRRYVWVAGDIGDGKLLPYDANHVQQFRLDGTLVHSYPVPFPVALAGTSAGDAAWVEFLAGYKHAAVRRLRSGTQQGRQVLLSAPDVPSGFATPLAACDDGVYALSENDNSQRTHLDRIAVDSGRMAGSVGIDDLGNSVLSCATRGAYLLIQDGTVDHLWRLAAGAHGRGYVLAKARLLGYTFGLGSSGGAPWVGLDASDVPGASPEAIGTRIWQLSARTLRPGPWIDVPVTMVSGASVATGRRLWTVGQVSAPYRWTITELVTR
jgi:hypothetical protein